MTNYKELLEEYKFELLTEDEDVQFGDGFVDYDEVYTKQIKSGEAVNLLVNKKNGALTLAGLRLVSISMIPSMKHQRMAGLWIVKLDLHF